MNKKSIAGLLGSALLLLGTQAHAEISWTFSSGGTVTSNTLGNTVSRTTDGVTASAQAWSNTNNGAGSIGSSSISTASSYSLETAYLDIYGGSGLGVKNRDASNFTTSGDYNDGNSPEHSVDNNQRYDSVLFSFSSAIDLNSVKIGWSSNDSDITVLAYTATGACIGSGTCSSDLSGKTYADLASYGWSLIGQYADLVAGAAKSVNPTNIVSSYWLIGAANTLVGGSKDTSKDYVKLLALAGDKYTPPCTPGTPGCGPGTSVPEPGTLLLMGAGLFGLSRFNARRPLRFAA
jgi:hypothetical protein